MTRPQTGAAGAAGLGITISCPNEKRRVLGFLLSSPQPTRRSPAVAALVLQKISWRCIDLLASSSTSQIRRWSA